MFIQDQMKFHELQAMWWINAASNGHCNARTILKGGMDGIKMTADELRDDAMQIAQKHIHLFNDCAEFRQTNGEG